jgi:hypothetical protein
MAASADQNPSRTAGDDRNLVTIDENYLAPTFEDRVVMFWEKHGRTITFAVVAVAVGLVASWGFRQFAEARERAIAAEFAAARDSASLRAFVAAHPSAPLAGAAHLRLADEAYSAGKFREARASYEAAIAPLAGLPLGERARIGSALSSLQAGDVAVAKTGLESIANTLDFSRSLRGEAAYHLAVLARDAGQIAEARKWSDLVLAADPSSFWAQRALQLGSALPANPPVAAVPATSSAPEASPAVTFPGSK